MKLGIIVDSSCGLTKEIANKKGWNFLPLYMTIDNREYADGIDMTADQYYKMIDLKMNVKTSATPPGIIKDVLSKASKEFDEVIVYGISSELSSQTNNIKIIAKEFSNIHVLDSKGVGYGIVLNCNNIEKMAKSGASFDQIISKAKQLSNSQIGFVIPENLEWLVKGGRASAAASSLANMLKIVPIISFIDGKLDKGGKGRVFKKTFIKASKKLINKQGKNNINYIVMSANNKDAKELTNQLKEEMGVDIEIKNFPPIIGNHVGKGALALIGIKK